MGIEERDQQAILDRTAEDLDRRVMEAAGNQYNRFSDSFQAALPAVDGTDARLNEGAGLITVVNGLVGRMRVRGGGMDGLLIPKQKVDVLKQVKDPRLKAVVESAAVFLETVQQDRTLPGYGSFRSYDSYLIKVAQEAIATPKIEK